jgi:trehalose utilization protein
MPSIKISKTQLPDPPEKIVLYTNDGGPLGILRFTYKNGITSVLEYAPGQESHRHYPLRSKHRQR